MAFYGLAFVEPCVDAVGCASEQIVGDVLFLLASRFRLLLMEEPCTDIVVREDAFDSFCFNGSCRASIFEVVMEDSSSIQSFLVLATLSLLVLLLLNVLSCFALVFVSLRTVS
ncbi:hypothetical protein O6H91_13G018200 [Diphasiastrum complanatum]|uniref:Uncharacterized protein n=1 Tax=Diphasiastrum complanatum TaxID=34168 RepID=A0ACC2BSL5_DIPCM|nr:hypothetical protein O6H91_13G018200 [Diphasiastrum complanatum]